MGNRYVVTRENITPTAGNDILTIVTASARRARLLQISIGGMGTSSAMQQAIAARSSGGTTGGGAITPSKADHTDLPSAASTVNTTWSVQPTIETNKIILGWNALGGSIIWYPPADRPYLIEARNAENISVRAPSGPTYQAMSISVVFEED